MADERVPLQAGDIFHRWTLLEPGAPHVNKGTAYPTWLCRCTCGAERAVIVYGLVSGHSKSCGCWKRDVAARLNSTHRQSKTRMYKAWIAMRARCLDPEDSRYADYGGRGITVAEEWRTDFVAFAEHIGPRPAGHSLDRIDNARGYEPGNVRWTTQYEQARNTRRNVWVAAFGETCLLSDWARWTGISQQTIQHRRHRGWPAERAMTEITHRVSRRVSSTKI